jgi:hypothetical protein
LAQAQDRQADRIRPAWGACGKQAMDTVIEKRSDAQTDIGLVMEMKITITWENPSMPLSPSAKSGRSSIRPKVPPAPGLDRHLGKVLERSSNPADRPIIHSISTVWAKEPSILSLGDLTHRDRRSIQIKNILPPANTSMIDIALRMVAAGR